jgi:TonB-dependent receptor
MKIQNQRWALIGCLALLIGLPGDTSAQDTGRIVGRVLNARTAQPLVSAQVYMAELSEGTVGSLTAVDGRYVIRDVPAGLHSVTIQMIGYATKTVTDVDVSAGRTTSLDVMLDEQAVMLSAITVTSTAERSSNTALLNERRLSVVVSDAIGAEQISRSPDGDAASALKRVPGLSVVDGKHAYVRGLGDRYTQTTLNGAPLASPEPDKKVIPLDVIPSDLLESIVTSKSYSPDQPGDYAGGLVQLRTRDFPSSMILNISASGEWNSEASFRNRLGYAGGGMDFLGFDDGTRGLPSAIPANVRVSTSNFSDGQLQEIGRAFQGEWGPTTNKLPLNGGLGISFGDDYDIGEDQRLGFIASANYSSSQSVRSDVVERVFNASGVSAPESDYRGEVSDRSVKIGGLLNLTYQPRPSDQIKFATVYNHGSNDMSRLLQGFNLDKNTNLQNLRIQFLQQSMLNSQLEGEHLLGFLGDATWKWRGAFTRASRYEPSTRESLYEQDTDGQYRWSSTVQSGSVFHQDMVDQGFTGGTSLRLPFELLDEDAAFMLGGSFERKDRTAYTRRFRFDPYSGPDALVDPDVRTLSPNELFGDETYIGPTGFRIQEATFAPDNYDGVQNLEAGYAMLEAEVFGGLRLSGGARVEHSVQQVNPRDIFQTGYVSAGSADLRSTDVLPAINATVGLNERMNLRASASRTLARPQLRELAPFGFADYAGGYLVLGNPDLDLTRITNLDLRFEWFRSPRSVFAVSTFFKDFEAPIEDAVLPGTELKKTWVNASGGTNYGVELEMRSQLDVIAERLADVSLNGNLTLVRSEMRSGGAVDIYFEGSGSTQLLIEERDRPLQGQSPYVLNLGLTWAPVEGPSASVLFNRFGERIDAIGALALPDVYESARSQLDVVVEWPLMGGWKAKVAAERLLGNEIEFTQGGELLRSYDTGRSFSFGLSWGAGR